VLGTDPVQIDTAEDRHKFSSVLDKIGVDQPEWTEATSLEAAKGFTNTVGSVGRAHFCFVSLLILHFFKLSRVDSAILCALWSCHERRL